MPLLDLDKGNADYASTNSILALLIASFLMVSVVLAGIYSGWLAVEMSVAIISLLVLMVIIFLLSRFR